MRTPRIKNWGHKHESPPTEMQSLRRCALLALVVIAVEKLTAGLILQRWAEAQSALYWALNVHSLIMYWLLPIAMVWWVERRPLVTLGLRVRAKDRGRYALYGLFGLVLPMLIVGMRGGLLIALAEQIALIALPEELLWRGYLQGRLTAWLGKLPGLLWAALLFGLGHLTSLFALRGKIILPQDLYLVLQTMAGGLILGAIYLRSKSIIPGAIVHIFGNVYLFKLVNML